MNNNDDIVFKTDNTFDNNGNDSFNNTPSTYGIPDIPTINDLVDENSIPAFTAFEVFPRFTKVNAGTTSNVEVNFDAMFSGTNQWDINKNYVSNVYVTQYNKDNPLSSKIYKSIQSINSSDQINITNTDYWQDETSTYFEILTDNNGKLKAYHKYINAIPACYTHAIRIKSSYDPNHQNVIIDWGDGTIAELSSARTLLENEELSNILGSADNGENDIIVIKPPTDTTQIKEQFGKNTAYEYYCYHDYMPAMVKDGIVIITHTTNDDGTINTSASANTSKPDKPYKVIIYGNSYFGIGKDGGVRINHYIKPEDAITRKRSIYSNKGFNNILISRLFEADLPFYQYSNITIASLANNAPNLLYINLPKYYDGFDGIINTYEAFKHCVNLQYCNGFNNKMRFKSLRGMCRMFSGCNNMLKCDIKLAKIVVDHHVGSVHDGNKAIFGGCSNLAVDLLSLLPLDGFSSRYMSLINSFNGCRSLDTTLENANIIKYILWKDTTKIWKTNTGGNNTASNSIYEKGTTATFQGCSQLNSLKITAPNGELVKFIPDGWNNLSAYKDPENINNITPLTFKSLGESTISLNKIGNPNIIQLEYSINNSEYKPYIINDTITLYNEWELKIRATDASNEYFSKDSDNYYKFVMTGQIEVSGNIQTLLNQFNTDTAPAYCYIKLFKDCTSLINIKLLDLPAIILNEHCYDSMFMNCSQIQTPISIDADTLSDYCYANMFYGCLLLTNVPTLHAKNLAIGCYKSMFENCTSLYNNFNALPSDILKDNCYDSMFKNCSKLTCTVIELPAKELASKCYYEMFSGCSKLSSISVKFTEWKEDLSATTNWVTNVATNGLFIAPNILPDVYDNSHIPNNWENEEYKEPEIEIPFNSEYGEIKIGLGEDKDEVALIFKNSDLASMEWIAPCDLENVEFLAVGGGGGGGGDYSMYDGYYGGGGGGGGGVVTGTIISIKKDAVVSVKVGAGGKGGIAGVKPGTSTNNYNGAAIKGKPSNISINNITYLSADGGGRDLGCSSSKVGTTGGSGGSSAGSRAKKTDQGTANKGKIIVSSDLVVGTTYGNKGGAGVSTISYAAGGGGGGTEEGYSPVDQNHGGNGGEGLSSDITGIMTVYGSGGGGGTATSGGIGGKGGTGAGNAGRINITDIILGKDALPNQGGGGGGGAGSSNGGSGGSGIVVLRFKPNIKVVDPDIPEEPTNIVIDIPKITQTSFEFNNTEQSISIPENNGYNIEGQTSAIDTGEYIIILKLNEGYIWSNGSSEDQEITWEITQATNRWITDPSISKSSWYENDTNPGVLTNGVAEFGEVVIKLNGEDFINLPTAIGTYTIEFGVEGNDNYTGLSKSISFEILSYDSQITLDDIMSSLDLNYAEIIPNLGEDKDEVAILFKDSTVDNIQWTIPQPIINAQFLAVAGGGGGGGAAPYQIAGKAINRGGAGGGGGGVVTGYINVLPKDSVLNIKVGAGGAGGLVSKVLTEGSGAGVRGLSTSFYVDDTFYLSASGGGRDLGRKKMGGIGGSIAGSRLASRNTDLTWKNTAINTDVITNGQCYGNLGGIAYKALAAYGARAGAGGGGAMEKGLSSTGNTGTDVNNDTVYGGKGGEGLSSDITGIMTVYGSGGGGGSGYYGYGGDGGTGAGKGGVSTDDIPGSRNGGDGLANQGGGGGGAGQGDPNKDTTGNGGNGGSGIFVLRFKVKIKPLNVLTIGNSFSKPLATSTALPLAVKKIGKKINYGHLYKGGLSLDQAISCIQNNTELTYTTCFTADDGTITENTTNSTITNALKSREWDIVTIQQRSVYSHDETKYKTYVNTIIDKIHEFAPNAKINWHLTWSFDRFAETVANTFKFNFNGNIEKRDNMYDNIVNAYNNKVKDFVDDVIPVGYAIQLYRYRLPVIEPTDDFTSKDHYHLNPLWYNDGNPGGIYLQTICWCYKLFRDAPTIEQFYPHMIDGDTYLLDETEISRLRQCAIDACNNADITDYGKGTIDFNWTVKFLDNNNNVIDTQTVSNGQCITANDIINNTSDNWLCEYRIGSSTEVITTTANMTLDEIKTKPIYDNITFIAQ